MKCMRVPDSRPWQEFWAHRVQGTHRSTLAKAGRAGSKGGGHDAPPGDEARKHAARANTAHAHGLTCKCSHSPAAGVLEEAHLPWRSPHGKAVQGFLARDTLTRRYRHWYRSVNRKSEAIFFRTTRYLYFRLDPSYYTVPLALHTCAHYSISIRSNLLVDETDIRQIGTTSAWACLRLFIAFAKRNV